jgi:hypothetical protein
MNREFGEAKPMAARHNGELSLSKTSAIGAAVLALCLGMGGPAAHAGSISANTSTYAGDAAGLNFPVGTVAVSDYIGYKSGGTYVDTEGNSVSGNLDLFTNVLRVDWMATTIGDMPLVVSAALPYASARNVTQGGLDLNSDSAFFSPTVFLTLGVIVDPQNERTLAFSNYFFFPLGDYDSTQLVNVSTPNQTVIVPQITYEEGLGKFSPALKNFWIDIFGGVAFHSDGDNPFTRPDGFGFDRTEQENSYDINLYLRYSWNPLTFVAVGIEKSWGGEQVAKGGVLGSPAFGGGDVSLSKDEFLKGHIQFGVPLSETMQLAADISHDFEREGGFEEDFTVEFRLSKILLPETQPMK